MLMPSPDTEMDKNVHPWLRDPASARGASSRNQGKLFWSYLYSDISSDRLRSYISECKLHSQRCSDPTECGTFVSGVTCEACEVGVMLPIDSLDVYSDWACSDCDFVLSFDVIEQKVDTIEDELSDISARGSLRKLEDFIDCYSGRVLHRNHYLVMLAKRNVLLIGRKKEVNRLAERGDGGMSPDDAR